MIATHGRGVWFVDVAPLEQVTPKNVGDVATLYAPRTAYQWGEGPMMGLPGNGWGQAPLVIQAPPYGATISYRLKDSVTGPVRITVSDAAGPQLYTTAASAARGIHSVQWAFQGAQAARAALSPSARRDSIILKNRAPGVIDSLAKAGYDSAALATVRRTMNIANNPPAALAGFGRGGGGGRGGAQAGCEHPMTQWDNFCARPGEPPPAAAGRGGRGAGVAGGAGGAAAVAADTSAEGIAAAFAGGGGRGGAVEPAQQKIWDIIGMKPPTAGGRGGGGGGFGGGGGNLVEPGTYVATLTAGGQTYKQTFRVERSGTGDGEVSAFEADEEDNQDLNSGILPKPQTSTYIRRDHQEDFRYRQ